MATDSNPISQLSDLLDKERKALLDGNLERVAQLLPPKEALIDQMNRVPQTDLASMQMLDGKVKRNQLLLDGALEGIRTVATRIEALRRVRNSLETYGADGKRRAVSVEDNTTVERRA
jgi:flagellar biosynthesis/type III secretory pathway chaperone